MILGAALFAPPAAQALSPADINAYEDAFRLFRAGNVDAGYAAAWRAESTEGRRIYEWLMLQRPRGGHSFAEIAAFIEARPHWPRMRTLRRRAEEALDASVSDADAAAFFAKYPPVSSKGVERQAAILAARGDSQAAAVLVRTFWRENDLGAVREREFLAAVGRYLADDDHIARMNRLLWEGEREDALRMFERVPAGWRRVGSARIALQKRSAAGARAVADVPSRLSAEQGLRYDHARWLRRQERLIDAAALSVAPPDNAEFAETWWTERRILSRKLIRAGRPRDAYAVSSAHGAVEGKAFAAGEFMAGWLKTRFLDEPLDGYRHFDRLYRGVSTPISQARGAYWAGRASEAVGDMDLARRWYAVGASLPTAYYGQLAAARLGEDGGPRFSIPPDPSTADRRAYESNDLIQALTLLSRVGAYREMRSFFWAARGQLETPGQKILLARQMRDTGRLNLSLSMAKTLAQEGVIAPDLLYPLLPLHGGDAPEPALVLAVIRQESAFDIDAVSHAGARGLMQLMPGTARKVARDLGLRYSRSRLTQDAAYNMRLGRAYLAQRLERFAGSYPLALAAYNAGSHRVDDWIEDFGDPREAGVDPVDWVEMIPFTETNNYVMRILESVQIYRAMVGRAQMARSLDEDLNE